jgi:AcrR family transcriptional regulator
MFNREAGGSFMAPTDDAAGQPLDARVIRTRNDILRVAVDVLTSEGLDAVTHQRLAEAAGYSRATIYKHWPTRDALFVEAFSHRPSGAHSVPSGDLRADLIAELTMFRQGMERHRLDRALAALATLSSTVPELAAVRDKLIAEGEGILLQLLTPVTQGAELEAAMRMLSGSVLQSALLHGYLPSDEVIAATVDLLLRGLAGSLAGGRRHYPARIDWGLLISSRTSCRISARRALRQVTATTRKAASARNAQPIAVCTDIWVARNSAGRPVTELTAATIGLANPSRPPPGALRCAAVRWPGGSQRRSLKCSSEQMDTTAAENASASAPLRMTSDAAGLDPRLRAVPRTGSARPIRVARIISQTRYSATSQVKLSRCTSAHRAALELISFSFTRVNLPPVPATRPRLL